MWYYQVCVLLLLYVSTLGASGDLSESNVSFRTATATTTAPPLVITGFKPMTLRGGKKVLSYHDKYVSDIIKSSAKSGFSGAIAGGVQVLALMWLRTAVNYQYRYGVPIGQALRDLYGQGGIPRFYRGLSFALVQGPLAKFGGSCANELSMHICNHFYSDSQSLVFSTILGGLLSGLWRFLLMPIDMCKTVLQVDGKVGLDSLLSKVFPKSLCFYVISITLERFKFSQIREEKSIVPLYKGAGATMLSTVVSSYPWLFVYNLLRSKIKTPDGVVMRVSVLQKIIYIIFIYFII